MSVCCALAIFGEREDFALSGNGVCAYISAIFGGCC